MTLRVNVFSMKKLTFYSKIFVQEKRIRIDVNCENVQIHCNARPGKKKKKKSSAAESPSLARYGVRRGFPLQPSRPSRWRFQSTSVSAGLCAVRGMSRWHSAQRSFLVSAAKQHAMKKMKKNALFKAWQTNASYNSNPGHRYKLRVIQVNPLTQVFNSQRSGSAEQNSNAS